MAPLPPRPAAAGGLVAALGALGGAGASLSSVVNGKVGAGIVEGMLNEPKPINMWETMTCSPQSMNLDGPPGTAHPSPGCKKMAEYDIHPWCGTYIEDGERTIEVNEPEPLGKTLRKYVVQWPKTSTCNGDKYSTPTRPAPLMLFFHGQYGTAWGDMEGSWSVGYGQSVCADMNGFVSLYPQGMNDHAKHKVEAANGVPSTNADSDLGTGWNVGSAGDERTCWKEEDGDMLPPTEYSCYESCLKLGKCGRCNWSTCHDDVLMVKMLLTEITNEFCIDMSRIYVAGESNGGMFTHRLYQELPNAFAAVSPLYATPLIGYLNGRHQQLVVDSGALKETAYIHLHDRQDRVIPMRGGLAASKGWTWYYESMEACLNLWAETHECDHQPTNLEVPFQHNPNFTCVEYQKCKTGRRIMGCEYNGHHGQTPKMHAGGNAVFWLFNQFRRSTVASWE